MKQTKNNTSDEKYVTTQIPDYLFDKISDLAKEYSMFPDELTAIAVKKLLDDIDFVRSLRSGKATNL